MRRLWILVLVLMAALLPAARPASAADNTGFTRYFSETGHNLYKPFLYTWETWGGLMVFGYPISEALLEQGEDGTWRMTQHLERNRFEFHPQHEWPYKVQLGRLGVDVLVQQGRRWEEFPKASPSAPNYFAETGHAIAPEFIGYWQSHGLEFGDAGVSYREALALWGFPISEATMETNSSGDTVLTQWFERARFEYHPHNPAAYRVLLGLLGNEVNAGRRESEGFARVAELNTPRAALQRQYMGTQQYLNHPVRYRHDLQQIADETAVEWTRVFNAGGDDRAVLNSANERMKAYPPFAKVLYAARNNQLKGGCGYDDRDPLANALMKYNIDAMAIGITEIYEGSCGPSVSMIIIQSQ